MLEFLITSRAKRNLLKLFLTNPDRTFYVREIARLTKEPVNAVRRELDYLGKAGLLKSSSHGNQKNYSVIKEFPFYPELKKIIYATVALGDYLNVKLSDSKGIELAFVYGSTARNEETAKSDIDLFVVGGINEDDLHQIIVEIEHDIGRQINYSLMDHNEFNDRRQKGEPFIKRILEEPKIILKDDNMLLKEMPSFFDIAKRY
ncbi:MAG TPA: nucleotidyltransferase domain-containing protein [Dehalococcoidales bacterium]|nr:nucleotidyltransferase domain-containing protein [Dehalococcoidales bacterium]